jgi:hypothetical protein
MKTKKDPCENCDGILNCKDCKIFKKLHTMEIITKKRESVIDELIESRIDTIMSDNFYLHNILEFGIKGFSELTNKELKEEFYTEFEEKIKIL